VVDSGRNIFKNTVTVFVKISAICKNCGNKLAAIHFSTLRISQRHYQLIIDNRSASGRPTKSYPSDKREKSRQDINYSTTPNPVNKFTHLAMKLKVLLLSAGQKAELMKWQPS